MANDVFLSYSSHDRVQADAACHFLEAAGIRVWMAPRNIVPGADWTSSIVDAVNDARILVLIFSANSNESDYVQREVQLAVKRGIPLIPFKTEDIVPSKSLEFFIGTHHWLDAMTPPMEQHFKSLAEMVKLFLTLDPKESKEGDLAARHRPAQPQDLVLAEARALAHRWSEADHAYYLVESVGAELKALVVNPPFDFPAEDEGVMGFLLLASLHYGSSWPFWTARNADNVHSAQQVIGVLGLSYDRPRFRAVCALQFFAAGVVEKAVAILGGSLDPRIRKLVESVVLAGRAKDYLEAKGAGSDPELAKKAKAVMRELARCQDTGEEDLFLP